MSQEQPAGILHGGAADGAGFTGGRGTAAPSRAVLSESDLAVSITVGSATLIILLWVAVLAWAAGWLAELIRVRPPWSVPAYLGFALAISAATGVTSYLGDRASVR